MESSVPVLSESFVILCVKALDLWAIVDENSSFSHSLPEESLVCGSPKGGFLAGGGDGDETGDSEGY